MGESKNRSETPASKTRSTPGAVARRDFMKSAAVAGAALATPAGVAGAEPTARSRTAARVGAVPIVTQRAETTPPSSDPVLTQDTSGSDFMIDVMKSLDIPYVFANAAATFRGLQESVINYGGNSNPEFITCVHEEQSAAMAHGYFKVEGKPAAIMAHSVVGLQHASMAIYNAFVDRVPIYVMLGNIMDVRMRITTDQWYHSVQDPAVMVRDYIKWDDEPVSLQHFAESAVRAYQIAMTPPIGPVVLTVDAEMAERPIPEADQGRLSIPRLVRPTPPQGNRAAVREVARLLVEAENPAVMAGGTLTRTQEGRRAYLELRDILGSPRASTAQADVIFAIEVGDLYGRLYRARDLIHRTWTRTANPDATVITLGLQHLNHKANYQNFYRYTEADLAITGDGEATLPLLIEEVRRVITPARRRVFEERAAESAAAAARAGAFASRRNRGMGREPDLGSAPRSRNMAADPNRGLVAGHDRHRRPDQPVELRHPLSQHWKLGRRGNGIRAAGVGGRGAREQEVRPLLGGHSGGWRLHVLAGRALDRGPSPDPAADGDAQQPGVPSGAHAHSAHGQPAESRY